MNIAHAKPYEHFHGGMTRPDVVRANYRRWSREGQTREWILRNITNMDGELDRDEHYWMDAHVSQMFDQMVRKLHSESQHFTEMLNQVVLGSGRTQAAVLEHIRKQLWAKMQQIDDDPSHTEIYKKVKALYDKYEQEQRDATFNPANQGPVRRSNSMWNMWRQRQPPTAVAAEMWEAIYEEEQSALIPQFWDAFDEQERQDRIRRARRQQAEWLQRHWRRQRQAARGSNRNST